jgi:branched-chain amino acid aminotransferase
MKLPYNMDQLIHHIYTIYKKVDCDNVYMRIQISRGEGKIGMSKSLPPNPNEVIIMYPFIPIDKKNYEEGVKVHVTSRLRNAKKAMDPNIKSGNYLNNVLSYIEGEKYGAFETFMVNSIGHITEGTTSNIFYVKGNDLVTPPSHYDLLEGITRRIVMSLGRNLAYNVVEKGFDIDELLKADEIFLTSSTREIVPICNINNKLFNVRDYRCVPMLKAAYSDHIDNYRKRALEVHPWK